MGPECQLLGTLSSEYGPRTVCLQSPAVDDFRPATAPVLMPKDVASLEVVDDRPRSAPVSWMTVVTDRVNALWSAFHGSVRVVAPSLGMTSRNLDVEMGVQQERRPSTWYDVSSSPVTTEQPRTKIFGASIRTLK